MKKTCVFLAGILLVIFIAYACEMPSSIELKSDRFEMNAPIKIGHFNLASVLSAVINNSFPEGFEIYDMINYQGAQAFLIAYQMDLMESFNPDDYLDILKNPEGIPPIYPDPIVIPNMTTSTISDTWFYFDMQGFFDNIRDTINDDSTPPTEVPLIAVHDQQSIDVDIPTNAVFEEFMIFNPTNNNDNFDAVFVHEGEIAVEIELDFGGSPVPSDLEITLHGVELMGPVYKNAPSPQDVTISYDSGQYKATITIDIGDSKIENDNPPQFSISSITSVYHGYSGGTTTFSFTLVMQPEIRGIKLRGAEALRIGRTERPVPPEIIQNIQLDSVADMLNAKIAEVDAENPLGGGSFRITPNLPANTGDGKTYCEGLKIGYEIKVNQPVVVYEGVSFPGLNATFIKSPFSDVNPLLAGELINGNELTVETEDGIGNLISKIIIEADPTDGVTFELFDDHVTLPYTNKKMPIKIDMGMNISKLQVVRWKTVGENGSILPPIDIPELNFANMGDENDVSFIKNITFNEIKLNIDFIVPDPPPSPPPGQNQLTPGRGLPIPLETHIALKLSCPKLGFNDKIGILADGPNEFTSDPAVLEVNHSDINAKVKFDAELIPAIGGVAAPDSKFIEFGPVEMGDDDITMNIYAQVSVEFDWEKAEIDIKAALDKLGVEEMSGTFPEDAGDSQINLSGLRDYMSGITFSDNLKAKIFLSGPDDIIGEIKLRLNFNAEWEQDDGTGEKIFMIDNQLLTVDHELPELHTERNSRGEWVYSKNELPEFTKGAELEKPFHKIFTAAPQDLRFNYEVSLPDDHTSTEVTPHTFEHYEGDTKIRALMVVLLPLELVAEPGGFFTIPDLFDSSDSEDGEAAPDLFGRSVEGEDSAFTGVNIKSLGIKIDFGYSIFAGSHFHFDKCRKVFGPDGLLLGQGNSLNIVFTSEQQKAINENLIYPDIRFEFPDGARLQIARNFLPVRIVISASGSYTLDLNDLFGSGN
jgi:hypothetical protein